MPSDLDKILALPEKNLPPVVTKATREPEEKKQEPSGGALGDIDPIFNTAPKAPDPNEKPIFGSQANKYRPYQWYEDRGLGAVAGAVTGAAWDKYGPSTEVAKPTVLKTAEANFAGKSAVAQQAEDLLKAAQAAHSSNIDDLLTAHKTAQAELSLARDALSKARASAASLGVLADIPNVSITTPPPGSSTIPGSLSEGALSHSAKMGEITQANTVRKGIAGTASNLSAAERMPLTNYTQLSRLIVPNEHANAPIYNSTQIAAQQALAQAEAEYKVAMANAGKAQAMLDKSKNMTPNAVKSAQSTAAKATLAVKEAEAKLAALKGGQSLASKIIGKIPGAAMGALSGVELANAAKAWNEGRPVEAVTSGLGGAGGLLMMAPYPPAKAVGALMQVPSLAYQGYNYFTEPKQ